MNNCLKCEKETTNPRFCSMSCSASYNNTRKPKRQRTRRCKVCDRLLVPEESRKCQDCVVSRLISKDRTIGSYKELATYQRSAAIRSHARTVIKSTRRPYVCSVVGCEYTYHLDVCHLEGIKSFSDDALIGEVNHPDNLTYMCRNHHWEFDHGEQLVFG